MNKNHQSDLRFTFAQDGAGRISIIIFALLIIAAFVTNHNFIPEVVKIALYALLGAGWGVCYVAFHKSTHTSLIKTCSLQLILCGLLGAILMVATNPLLPDPIQFDLIQFILIAIMFGICLLRSGDVMTSFLLTFLLFPFAIFSTSFFLIGGFLSGVLILIAFFIGTVFFDKERLDEDEYFGNSSH